MRHVVTGQQPQDLSETEPSDLDFKPVVSIHYSCIASSWGDNRQISPIREVRLSTVAGERM